MFQTDDCTNTADSEPIRGFHCTIQVIWLSEATLVLQKLRRRAGRKDRERAGVSERGCTNASARTSPVIRGSFPDCHAFHWFPVAFSQLSGPSLLRVHLISTGSWCASISSPVAKWSKRCLKRFLQKINNENRHVVWALDANLYLIINK